MKNFILKTIVILLAWLIGFGGSVVIYYLLSDEFSAEQRYWEKQEKQQERKEAEKKECEKREEAEKKECKKHLKKVAYIAKMTGKTSILEIEGQLNETTACDIHWGYNRTIYCNTHSTEVNYRTTE